MASVARIRTLVSGTPKSAQVVLNLRSAVITLLMTSCGIGPFWPVVYCASYSEIPSRSWKTVGSERAVEGDKSVMEKRIPLLSGSQVIWHSR